MVWEQKSSMVVMLTNLRERNNVWNTFCLQYCQPYSFSCMQAKCHKYWPSKEDGLVNLDGVLVKHQKQDIKEGYTIRTFFVQRVGSSDEMTVNQYHFTSWPDYGIPTESHILFNMVEDVLSASCVNTGPIVVHCRYHNLCSLFSCDFNYLL